MTSSIVLLRAVNVAGRNQIAMAELRKLLESLGCTGVRTLLQSGNAVVQADWLKGTAAEKKLEKKLEGAIAARFELAIDVMVRSSEELNAAIERNPFPQAAVDDPGHLVAMFLKQAPTAAAVEGLRAAIVGRETIQAIGRELYLLYPDGIGRSKLTTALIEKKLDTRVTGRNWNTLLKLQAIAADAE